MQWRMLGRRGQQASWTIVGDAAQSAWPDLGEARRARQEALRGKQMRRFHLTTNYRNSAEIFEFAADIVRRAVPDADLPVAVRRTGSRRSTGWPAPADLRGGGGRARWPSCWRRSTARSAWSTPGGRAAADGRRLARPVMRRVAVQVVDGMRAKGMEYDGVRGGRTGEIEASRRPVHRRRALYRGADPGHPSPDHGRHSTPPGCPTMASLLPNRNGAMSLPFVVRSAPACPPSCR